MSSRLTKSKYPRNLEKKLRAEDDYLVLLLSPADKNFFRVENIYQLEKEMDRV